jgi:hypothetical protein
VGIEKHVESMSLAFNTENYMQALQIGKEVLRKVPQDDFRTKAGIYYDMACAHAMLFNVQHVVSNLQSARSFGFSDFQQLDEDRDFDSIRFQFEFMTFRQAMEFEVLQTERWRELSEAATNRITALFDSHDEDGVGTLSFSQFQALCKGSFGIAGPAQVMSFWREICEDTIEAMHLVEFMNFLADHKDLLARLMPQSTKPLLSQYMPSPIHTSTLFFPSQSSGNEVQSYQHTHTYQHVFMNPFSHAMVEQPPHYGGAVQQACWAEEMPQWRTPNMYQQNLDLPSTNYVTTHFSYYTTTDPLASFRC